MVKNILPLLPKHHHYVEVFCGGAKLLFGKEPSKIETINDLNSDLVNFYRMLRDHGPYLQKKLDATPYSREEWEYCRKYDGNDSIERARCFFVRLRQSFGGIPRGWSFNTTNVNDVAARKFRNAVERFEDITERLKRVQIECRSFEIILLKYNNKDVLFYLDPPYIHSTRTKGSCRLYDHEMTDDQHKQMVELLLNLKAKCILSGYQHEIYSPLERAGWQRRDYSQSVRLEMKSKKERKDTIESLWLCPQTVEELNAQATPLFDGE